MILVLCSSVFAYRCNQEGCTDFNLEGGLGFSAYSFNIPNQATEINYSKCVISGSDFTPIIDDFTGDFLYDILITDGQVISLYSKDCTLIVEQDLGIPIAKIPTSVNYDTDDNIRELAIGSGKYLYIYEFSQALNRFVVDEIFNGSACNSVGTYLTCYGSPTDVCYNFGSSHATRFNLKEDSVDCLNSNFPNNMIDSFNFRNGISNTRNYYNTDFSVPLCMFGSQHLTWLYHPVCHYVNETGGVTASMELKGLGGVLDIEPVIPENEKINFYSSFVAKLGSNFRIFIVLYSQGLDYSISKIYSQGGTELFSANGIVVASNHTSNFVVGDYDKNGINDVCFLVAPELPANKTYFRCLNSALNVLINQDVTGTIGFTTGLVLADFNPDKSSMGIGTYEGIYYIENTTYVSTLYETNITSTMANQTSLAIYTELGSSSPVIVWTDDTTGFIASNNLVSIACGNGVCDTFENAWSCEEDCNISATPTNTTGDSCNEDIDCTFGGCFYGFCDLLSGGSICDYDDDCLSDDCSNNVCTKSTWWESIDNTKDKNAGDDVNTNNMLAIIITLLISSIIVIVVSKTGAGGLGAVAGGITFLVLAIFFTIVGWLSAFIMFGIVLLLLVALVIGVMMGGGGTD